MLPTLGAGTGQPSAAQPLECSKAASSQQLVLQKQMNPPRPRSPGRASVVCACRTAAPRVWPMDGGNSHTRGPGAEDKGRARPCLSIPFRRESALCPVPPIFSLFAGRVVCVPCASPSSPFSQMYCSSSRSSSRRPLRSPLSLDRSEAHPRGGSAAGTRETELRLCSSKGRQGPDRTPWGWGLAPAGCLVWDPPSLPAAGAPGDHRCPLSRPRSSPRAEGVGPGMHPQGLTALRRGLLVRWQPGQTARALGTVLGPLMDFQPIPSSSPSLSSGGRASPAQPSTLRWRPASEVLTAPHQGPKAGSWGSSPAAGSVPAVGSWGCKPLEHSLFLREFRTQPPSQPPDAKGTGDPTHLLDMSDGESLAALEAHLGSHELEWTEQGDSGSVHRHQTSRQLPVKTGLALKKSRGGPDQKTAGKRSDFTFKRKIQN